MYNKISVAEREEEHNYNINGYMQRHYKLVTKTKGICNELTLTYIHMYIYLIPKLILCTYI